MDIKGSMNKEKRKSQNQTHFTHIWEYLFIILVHIYYLIENFFYTDTSVQILTPGERMLRGKKNPTRQYLLVH